ncbi:hypothetical protein EDC96DRAFT_612481 [Choanephora cucurbitarum]|nr:hypothetical protein EDC96DRAFT_612481 [Choanephora cucurbitarum]
MSMILGYFGSSKRPFCLYRVNQKMYFNVEEINHLFLKNQWATKANLICRLFKAHSIDFMKATKTGQIYVMKNTMMLIARLFNAYCLAELCKLTSEEIMVGHIIEPLLNAIQDVVLWSPSTTFELSGLESDISLEPLTGDEWIFHAQQENKPISSTKSIVTHNRYSHHPLYKWLSFDLSGQHNSPDMIQTLISVAKIKKQQQAIIETRQRQSAFIRPTQTPYPKKQKASRLQHKKQPPLYHKGSHETDHRSYHSRTALPPSPPPHKKRKSIYHSDPIPIKKRLEDDQETLPSLSTSTSDTTHSSSYQQYLIDHGNDNLNLLATQATQLRGLPLSPEVSPSPPPIVFKQQQDNLLRLPSLQTILTELNCSLPF